jgi:nitronate monooxygenase
MLHSPFARQWEGRHEDARHQAKQLQDQIIEAIAAGKLGELLPFAGQTVGLIRGILPAAEITRQIAAEAEVVLRRSMKLLA